MPTPELKLPGDTVSPLLIRYDIANDTYSVIKKAADNSVDVDVIIGDIDQGERKYIRYNSDKYYIIDFDRPYNIKPVDTTTAVDISKCKTFNIKETHPLIVKKENKGNCEIMSNNEYDKLGDLIKNKLNNLYKQDGRPCVIDINANCIYYCVYFGVPKSFVMLSDVAADAAAKAAADSKAADAAGAAGGSRHLKRSRKKGKDKKKATSTGNKKKSATKHKSKSKSKGKSKGNAT